MSDKKLVWTDEDGDLRNSTHKADNESVDTSKVILLVRRLTSGKGRTVIEIKGLPQNKNWNKKLAKDLKKKLGVGGAYKQDYIEIHGEKLTEVTEFLDSISIKWKKTGG